MLNFEIKKEGLEKSLNTFSLAANILKQWISIIDKILTITQQNCSSNHFYNVMYDFPLSYTNVVYNTFFQTFRIMGFQNINKFR